MHKNRHRVDKNPVFLFCVWLNLGWWGNKGGAVELVGADGVVASLVWVQLSYFA